jgi:hypothetical protein
MQPDKTKTKTDFQSDALNALVDFKVDEANRQDEIAISLCATDCMALLNELENFLIMLRRKSNGL